MLFLNRFDAREALGLIPQATVMMGVPTYYSRLLAMPELTRAVVANMRLFISGSAPLSAEVHRAFSERTGLAILERYGMTETSMNTSNPYDGERRAGTVGFLEGGSDEQGADIFNYATNGGNHGWGSDSGENRATRPRPLVPAPDSA